MARWGTPSPVFALKAMKTDPGVTKVRSAKSPHWHRWLGIESRRIVPFTSFSENEVLPNAEVGAIHPEALMLQRPLADGALRIVARGAAAGWRHHCVMTA
jgi:putative SOS response-associated peptidase YedK